VLAPSLAALFQQGLDDPDASDFEREVLTRAIETGGITQEDYEEGFRRYISCMIDSGYEETYEKRSDGIYTLKPPQKIIDGSQAALDTYAEMGTTCADGTVMRIEALYNEQLNNPGLLADPYEVATACLVQAGLVGPDYKPDQLKKDLAPGDDDVELPFDPSDSQAQQCLNGAGFAYATA
jgi:hypothetical protein